MRSVPTVAGSEKHSPALVASSVKAVTVAGHGASESAHSQYEEKLVMRISGFGDTARPKEKDENLKVSDLWSI